MAGHNKPSNNNNISSISGSTNIGSTTNTNNNGRTKSNNKTRDSDCCSINFVKYVLHIFNIIFFMSGVAVTAAAVWTIIWKHQYVSLLATPTYVLASYGLLLAGVLTIGGAIWGCCGIWREQRSMLCCYSFILISIFALEFIVGGVSYIYETQIDDELVRTMNTTFMTTYGIDEERTMAIDAMQQNFNCCGAIRFEEWRDSIWKSSEETDLLRPNADRLVPDSCCISFRVNCGARDHPSNIPYTGCIYRFIDETRDHLNILAAVGSGLCFIQLFGLMLSCCLFCKLKNLDD